MARTPPKKICHLTLLNPARHSRIFYKEALTLLQTGADVTVIGPDTAATPYLFHGIKIVPLPVTGRGVYARLRQQWLLFRLASKDRAAVYHVHTPELLPLGWLLKSRTRAAIVYDVHEDYARNLRYRPGWPQGVRKLLAAAVRRLERAACSWLALVVYAEACFAADIALPARHAITVTNACVLPPPGVENLPPIPDDMPVMLYSGAIAEIWGVFEALELWRLLNQHRPVRLLLAGSTLRKSLVVRINNFVERHGLQSRFLMVGGGAYCPYPVVMQAIARCTFGTALYHEHPSINGRMPTRFFEFMAHHKPLVFTNQPDWVALNDQYRFGLAASLAHLPAVADALLAALDDNFSRLYNVDIPTTVYLWDGAPIVAAYDALLVNKT